MTRPDLLRRGSRLGAALALVALLLITFITPAAAAGGAFDLALKLGGTSAESAAGVAVDGAGNIYVAGSFRGTISLGSGARARLLEAVGGSDIFLARFRPDGSLDWAASAGGPQDDSAEALSVGQNGQIYLAGTYREGARFGGLSPLKSGDPAGDRFIARFSPAGAPLWAAVVRGEKSESIGSLAVDHNGNAYLVGGFDGRLFVVDANGGDSKRLSPIFGREIFVARYNAADGKAAWAYQGFSPFPAQAADVAVDTSGVYLVGSFRNHIVFDGATLNQNRAFAEDSSTDIVVARYDFAGNVQWVRRHGTPADDSARSIALGGGKLFFAGVTSDGGGLRELLLARYSRAGAFERSTDGTGTEVSSLAADSSGNLHLTGSRDETAGLGQGPDAAPAATSQQTADDLFVVSLTSDFSPRFELAPAAPAAGATRAARHLALDRQGHGFLVGDFSGALTLGPFDLASTAGSADVFLTSYRAGASPAPTPTPSPSVLYLSGIVSGSAGGVAFNDEDILAFEPATRRYSMLIDGSDIGLAGVDVDGFHWLDDNTVLISTDAPVSLPGLAEPLDDSDVVRFIPSRLGTQTAGSYELFFDGSDLGLTTEGADLDAIAFDASGRLLVSTLGGAILPGAAGPLVVADEEVLRFDGSTGPSTRGTFSRFFNGATAGLTTNEEDVSTLWTQANGASGTRIFLSAQNSFQLSNGLSGGGDDIFVCGITGPGAPASCAQELFYDGAAAGFPTRLDAFALGLQGVLGEISPGEIDPAPPEPGDDSPAEPDDLSLLHLPLLQR